MLALVNKSSSTLAGIRLVNDWMVLSTDGSKIFTETFMQKCFPVVFRFIKLLPRFINDLMANLGLELLQVSLSSNYNFKSKYV